jgi:AbrB family looped-hinge helix DNA binding protein
MTTVALSSKFQVVIPKDVRRTLNLVSGQRMNVQLSGGKVVFMPEKTVASLRGRWPSICTRVDRNTDRMMVHKV